MILTNYRAITLSSVLLKIYERLLLNCLPPQLLTTSPLQGGFQKGISCQMTSFLLRESVYYARENGSKLYVLFFRCPKSVRYRLAHGIILQTVVSRN